MNLMADTTTVHVMGYRYYGPFDTVIVFEGEVEEGRPISFVARGPEIAFGVDRRMARELFAALDRGEVPMVEIEDWQVVR